MAFLKYITFLVIISIFMYIFLEFFISIIAWEPLTVINFIRANAQDYIVMGRMFGVLWFIVFTASYVKDNDGEY